VSWAARPWRAAERKFIFASSNERCLVTSSSPSERAFMRPYQSAALAISSSGVGPEGITRASMRRCGLPSVMP
jgi:hypothetical protein